MKRAITIFLALMIFVISGCSFKVKQDTFNIPQGSVQSVEIQREYKKEDGTSYYCSKAIEDARVIEEICQKLRDFPAQRAPINTANPMRSTPVIVILSGKTEHRLILNEEKAFYDKAAFLYEKADAYADFVAFYEQLDFPENETTARPF